ncbi:NrfD protein [hydrothermal vent metagenome]|uniref:NrfD protein n=2 Tax=hydrothermal vent metagenome TaxID=652676 RepID=A0A3B0TZB6_9ZZZZ
MYETLWGLPVIGYLFLAGVGAGALTVSASVLLRGGAGGFSSKHFQIARYGALLAPLPLILGTGMIIFELGTFRAAIENGEFFRLFKFINLFLTVNMSPMNIGSWLLGLCILLSLAYAYTFLPKDAGPNDDKSELRRALAWAGIPFGIAVAIYTGVMLGAMPARPFWNTPVLALLFLLSALSGGTAGILLLKAIFDHNGKTTGTDAKAAAASKRPAGHSEYLLATSDMLFIGFEILAVFLFIMYAQLTVGAQAHALNVILPGGELALLFWGGVVLVGMLIPLAIELRYVVPALVYHKPYMAPRSVDVIVAVIVLSGGFLLRYVVVIAGQITGPVGI